MGKNEKFDLVVALKANSSDFQKNMNSAKKNLKGFTSNAMPAFSQLNGKAGMFVSTFQQGAGAIRGMLPAIKSVKAALLASGIGAIIVGIGVALAATSAWIKRTTDGADAFHVALERGKAVGNVYMDRLAAMGRAFVKLHKNFREGWADMKESVKGIYPEMMEEQKKAAELARIENKLKADKIDFIVTEAKLVAGIADTVRESKNLEYDREKRQTFLAKSMKLQNQLSDERVRMAQIELDLQKQRMAMGEDSWADKEKEANLTAELFRIETDRDNKARELENRVREVNGALNEQEKIMARIALDQDKIAANIDKVAQTVKSTGPSLDDLYSESLAGLKELDNEVAKMKDYPQVAYMGLKGVFTDINNLTSIAAAGIYGISAAFTELAETGKMSTKGMVTAVLTSLEMLIQGYLAVAMAKMIAAESAKGLIGLVTASAGVALLMALWKSKVPDFAAGGIVYGDTLARVGEYQGASSNPEVIAPLNKLKGMLDMEGHVTFELDGVKLRGVLRNVQQRDKLMK